MLDIFDNKIVSKIDMEKTAMNGKAICELYQPLVEKRLRQLNTSSFNSASILLFSGGTTGSAASDKLLKMLSWHSSYLRSPFPWQRYPR